MATIIAGRLQLQAQAEQAIQELIQAGFVPEKTTSFYVNPPGQHAVYPIGGDRFHSPGIEEMDKSIGFGTGVTAITEAVIGADVKPHDVSEHANPDTAHSVLLRGAGMLIAVELNDQIPLEKVVDLLKRIGASHIEKAEGEIVNGEWLDFDPLSEPHYL
jgi:hypothetical protein